MQGREQDKQRHAGVWREQVVQHYDRQGVEREAEGHWGRGLLSTPRCAIRVDVNYVPELSVRREIAECDSDQIAGIQSIPGLCSPCTALL